MRRNLPKWKPEYACRIVNRARANKRACRRRACQSPCRRRRWRRCSQIGALLAEDRDGLLDAFGEELQRARVRAGIETGGDELRARDHVPAFGVDGNFCRWQRIEIRAGDFGGGTGAMGLTGGTTGTGGAARTRRESHGRAAETTIATADSAASPATSESSQKRWNRDSTGP